MNTMIRGFIVFFATIGLAGAFANCTPFSGWPKTIDCGPGFVYNQELSACIEEDRACNPACDSDHKCRNGECVPRLKKSENPGKTECAIACGDGEICQNNACVPAPCNPPCQAGFTCSHGVCTPTDECIPPCQQTGYVCIKGECEKICPQECEAGKECIRGSCQTPCKPECQKDFFCNDGKCQKLEDGDGDGFRSDRDCNDKDKTINPGAVEECNGKDNDCDGQVDNISPKECYDGPAKTLGVGKCVSGRTTCEKGVLKCDGEIQPDAQENCKNQLDDDCNGQINDGCP